jgi:replication initiation protein RepC
MRLSIDELLQLAPRLQTYLTTPNPVWRDIVDAADWLRGEMGISRPLWGEACLTMGRECAAVAVALVSARPAEYFRTSPGGYFHGMVAKVGELNLVRTIWGLRQGRAARERGSRLMALGRMRPEFINWRKMPTRANGCITGVRNKKTPEV